MSLGGVQSWGGPCISKVAGQMGGGLGPVGILYGEVQCVMDNGHMLTPEYRQTQLKQECIPVGCVPAAH